MRAVAVLVAVAMCMVVTGCGTHRRDLESKAPMQGAPSQGAGEFATSVVALLDRESSRMNLLSSEALVPLTEAAAATFRQAGSPHAYALIQRFASALLAARVTRAGGSGFFGAGGGSAPVPRITAAAGLALARAYSVTGNSVYMDAAREAANDVTSRALGWVASPPGDGAREAGNKGPNIAMTANAALLLKRAGAYGDSRLVAKSRAAFSTIFTSQAAVGRCYADVGGRRPMSLSEWGMTLFDLSSDGSKESLGILAAGMPGLYANAFDAHGQLLQNGQTKAQPLGVAMTLRALASWEETSLADKAFEKVVELRRADGTVSLAEPDDDVSQSYFALAFAQRLAGPVHGE